MDLDEFDDNNELELDDDVQDFDEGTYF